MPISYDYNTGKPLASGQAQSGYNTQTGQQIGAPMTPMNSMTPNVDAPLGSNFNLPTMQEQTPQFQDLTPQDEAGLRSGVMAQYQGEINASKDAFSRLLAEQQQQGIGRLGENTAVQARRGLQGSSFGSAMTEGVRSTNLSNESRVLESQAVAIANIMNRANQDANSEIANKRAAKRSGFDSTVAFNKEKETRRQSYIGNLTDSLISSGQDYKILSDENLRVLKGNGISQQDIINSYLTKKSEKDAAQAESDFTREGEMLKRGKTEAEIFRINADVDLDKKKFTEDARRFGMDHALKVKAMNRTTGRLQSPTGKPGKTETEKLQSSTGQTEVLSDKIQLIDNIKASSGLNQRVGSNIVSRIPSGFWSGVGKAASIVGLPTLITGALAESSGSGQSFAGDVHRLTNQEFLDKLIDAKSRGATFGALTDREGDALRSAATQLNDWEIKNSKGIGTGIWNIDEKSFNAELDRIKELAQTSLQRSTGLASNLQEDEKAQLDSLFDDPANYF